MSWRLDALPSLRPAHKTGLIIIASKKTITKKGGVCADMYAENILAPSVKCTEGIFGHRVSPSCQAIMSGRVRVQAMFWNIRFPPNNEAMFYRNALWAQFWGLPRVRRRSNTFHGAGIFRAKESKQVDQLGLTHAPTAFSPD